MIVTTIQPCAASYEDHSRYRQPCWPRSYKPAARFCLVFRRACSREASWTQSTHVSIRAHEIYMQYARLRHVGIPIVVKSYNVRLQSARHVYDACLKQQAHTSYLLISAISSSICTSPGGGTLASPCSAVDTAKERRELMEGRRTGPGFRLKDVDCALMISGRRPLWRRAELELAIAGDGGWKLGGGQSSMMEAQC